MLNVRIVMRELITLETDSIRTIKAKRWRSKHGTNELKMIILTYMTHQYSGFMIKDFLENTEILP